MDDVCVVSGIGCSGRFSSYINCNTVHTTHGRTLAYATGIKLANPTKKLSLLEEMEMVLLLVGIIQSMLQEEILT